MKGVGVELIAGENVAQKMYSKSSKWGWKKRQKKGKSFKNAPIKKQMYNSAAFCRRAHSLPRCLSAYLRGQDGVSVKKVQVLLAQRAPNVIMYSSLASSVMIL